MNDDFLSSNGKKSSDDNNYTFAKAGDKVKCVIVGDGGTGKTSLLIVYTEGRFPDEYIPTVFDNYSCVTEINGKKVTLMLWDTAGQEDYDRLRPLSYDYVDVMIICYDVASPSTFENITVRWAPETRHFCPRTPVILVACKTDLRPRSMNDQEDIESNQDDSSIISCNDTRKQLITTSEGEDLARTIKASAFIECSAKENDNVHQIFATAIQLTLDRLPTYANCTCCTVS